MKCGSVARKSRRLGEYRVANNARLPAVRPTLTRKDEHTSAGQRAADIAFQFAPRYFIDQSMHTNDV